LIQRPYLTFICRYTLSFVGSHKRILFGVPQKNVRLRKALPRPKSNWETLAYASRTTKHRQRCKMSTRNSYSFYTGDFFKSGVCVTTAMDRTRWVRIFFQHLQILSSELFIFWSRVTEVCTVVRLETQQPSNSISITGTGKKSYSSPKNADQLHSPPLPL
jgi:hypothetical protein